MSLAYISSNHIEISVTEYVGKPCIAQRFASVKKTMYAIFFSTRELAVRALVPKSRSMNASFCKKISF